MSIHENSTGVGPIRARHAIGALPALLAFALYGGWLLLAGSPPAHASDEAKVDRLIRTIAEGRADAISETFHELSTESFRQQMGAAGFEGLAARMAGWGGFEAMGLDVDGEAWTISGRTGDGTGIRMVLTFENGRLANMRMRMGTSGEPSRLPALRLPRPSASDSGTSEATGTSEVVQSALDRFFEQLGPFSGTVLVAHRGEAIYRHASGLASRSFDVPNRVDTRFDLGSINKIFTKLAIARLLQEGRLSLDDTLDRHLADFPNPEQASKITIEHLVFHRSGLGDIFNQRYQQTPKDLLRQPEDYYPLFAGEPLLFEPGTGRSYSNAGYQMLGAVIESVTDRPYHDVIRDWVFEPAAMASTDFLAADAPRPKTAIGYTHHGAPEGEVRNNLFMLPVIGSPAGSSFSTIDDMLRFDRALREHRLLDAAHSEWVLGGPNPGTTKAPPPPSRAAIGVAGGAPGVSALLESDGELTVIALSNFDEPGAADVGSHLWRQLASYFGLD